MITITIDDGRAAEISAWLGELFDKASRRPTTFLGRESRWDECARAAKGGEYSGARDALAALGIDVQYDPQTKRPTGIARRGSADKTESCISMEA